jgi:CheY-like chemotaxis protein
MVNARDAMQDGGTIAIAARKRSLQEGQDKELPQGDYVCLSVQDEGQGMDSETLEKATTPFFTTKGIGKGTGLGLPMVQGLMAQAGGCLLMKSSPGEGTIAELWLPVSTGVAEPSAPVEKREAKPLRPLAVLVVDDDSLVLMNTILMLEDLGHSTMQANAAQQALQSLERRPLPDVVITDHAMPGMTGAELAAEVRRLYPMLPVILATGYAELPPQVETAMPRLAKPFNQQQLGNALGIVVEAAGT